MINYDQTGIYIRPNTSQTFEVRGSKQVSVSGNDEKRAYTLGIATTPDGPVLLEQVWSGVSAASLPADKADGYKEARDHGFHFAFTNSKKRTSHFSTEKTMEELIEFIIWPYIQRVIADDPNLDDNQKAILYCTISTKCSGDGDTRVFSMCPKIAIIQKKIYQSPRSTKI
jgi:hypothetical protein